MLIYILKSDPIDNGWDDHDAISLRSRFSLRPIEEEQKGG